MMAAAAASRIYMVRVQFLIVKFEKNNTVARSVLGMCVCVDGDAVDVYS